VRRDIPVKYLVIIKARLDFVGRKQGMKTVKQNEQAIRQCVELFNKCTLDWVDTCYAEEAEWIELPIPGISRGRQGRLAFLRETAGRVLELYPDRQLRILNLVAPTDQVVLA